MAIIAVGNRPRLLRLGNTHLGVSMLTATAIVVGDMIGVGVFTSLGFQAQVIPSAFSLVLLWLVGGGVALCGVFSYGELAAMFPRSSGEDNFFRQIYHPPPWFLAGRASSPAWFAAPTGVAPQVSGADTPTGP